MNSFKATNAQLWDAIRSLDKMITRKLTLKQFEKIMGISSYYFRAQAIKKVTSARQIHIWCDSIIASIESMKGDPCDKCGLIFKPYFLKDGRCNGCRNPHLIVKEVRS